MNISKEIKVLFFITVDSRKMHGDLGFECFKTWEKKKENYWCI